MGCHVIATSRFPHTALYNYTSQHDYSVWKHKLTLYGLDLLDIKNVNNFCEHLNKIYKFDIIINNACQTIRPSTKYMNTMLMIENNISKTIQFSTQNQITTESNDLEPNTQNKIETLTNINKTQTPINAITLKDKIDPIKLMSNKFYDIIDIDNINNKNSWTKTLDEIDINEILECNLINQISPMTIIKLLAPNMNLNSFILNVTSIEGNYHKSSIQEQHVHTNMTKASLDMLTNSLHNTWIKKQIYVFSVDPGYVSGIPSTDIDHYPLQPEDGASRILYPMMILLDNKSNNALKQQIIKNYRFKDFKPYSNK